MATPRAVACTNLIAGKGATTDGSVFCTYADDSYGRLRALCHYPAAKHAPGEMRKIYDWGSLRYLGEIPEAAETYNVIGNINEWQVSIGETTYGGREEMVDSTGLIDYGSLIYIALQRSKSAREAIRTITSLAERYGYRSEGETFTVCDPNEAWIMEIMGKGPGGKGAVWVALRIPDECICGHANMSRIRTFNMKDKANVMYAKDVVAFARRQGWFTGKDAEFSWADTYAPATYSGRRHCDARVWTFFNMFTEDGSMSEYLPWAMGLDPDAKVMPLWVKPSRKLSVADMERAMRDHFEGTPLSMLQDDDPGKGLYETPYRTSPYSFELDGVKYACERPISTQQTVFVYVSQLRSWLPRQIGGVFWFGNDDGNMVPFTPVYCSMTERPECFATPDSMATTFTRKSAYWMANYVSNMVYPRYNMLFPALQTVRDSLDHRFLRQQPQIEAEAQRIYKAEGDEAAARYLNNYTNKEAQAMLAAWQRLATYIVVKFNDQCVKPGHNGQFARSKYGLGATVERPGYSEFARRSIAKGTGERLKMPQQ